jgi:uncharacterized protein (TIGR02001 family)
MKLRKASSLVALGCLAALCLSGAASAEEKTEKLIPGEFSGTLTGVTDYYFRGISQTDHIPAIQGSFDYNVDVFKGISIYAGTWASNVNFNDGNQAQIEIDTYFGLKGAIDKFSWSVGGLYYAYPGASSGLNYNYWEITGTAGYDFGFLSVTGALNYSPDYFAASGDAFYVAGDVSVPIPVLKDYEPYVALHVGHQWIQNNTAFGTPDYTDWSVGVGAKVFGFDVAVKYVDTNLSNGSCFGGTDLCQARGILSVSKTF